MEPCLVWHASVNLEGTKGSLLPPRRTKPRLAFLPPTQANPAEGSCLAKQTPLRVPAQSSKPRLGSNRSLLKKGSLLKKPPPFLPANFLLSSRNFLLSHFILQARLGLQKSPYPRNLNLLYSHFILQIRYSRGAPPRPYSTVASFTFASHLPSPKLARITDRNDAGGGTARASFINTQQEPLSLARSRSLFHQHTAGASFINKQQQLLASS